MVAKKKEPVSTVELTVAPEEIKEVIPESTFAAPEAPKMTDAEEAAAIKERINELKNIAAKEDPLAASKGLLSQLPREKNSAERGEPIESCAARVMASQSVVDVSARLLALAKTRNALKKQGYELLPIEAVMDKLEEAYEI